MTGEVSAMAADTAADEAAIGVCVRRFYERAQKDALLKPVFDVSVTDWEHHFSKIQDFWSRALLGTERYSGFPFPVHMQLPVEPEHFSRWLALFEETASETLKPELAGQAIEKARHMATCFQSGIFPFVGKDGRPSRLPG
jgi:hemoglobin